MDAGTKVTYFGGPGTVAAPPEGSQDPAPADAVWVVFDDANLPAQWVPVELAVPVAA